MSPPEGGERAAPHWGPQAWTGDTALPPSPLHEKPKHSGPPCPHEEKEDMGWSCLGLPLPAILCLCCTQCLPLQATTATTVIEQGPWKF